MDYNILKDECVEWIRNRFAANGPECCAVLGMSSGKDSTVAAAAAAAPAPKPEDVALLEEIRDLLKNQK